MTGVHEDIEDLQEARGRHTDTQIPPPADTAIKYGCQHSYRIVNTVRNDLFHTLNE